MTEPQKTLTVLLDGIPYGCIADLHGSNHFLGFDPPVPYVTTFPSLTDPAYSIIFGNARCTSYGSLIYDQQLHVLRPKARHERASLDIDFQTEDSRFALAALAETARFSNNRFLRHSVEILRHSVRLFGRTWESYCDYELEMAAAHIGRSSKNHLRVVLNSFDEFCHREGLDAVKKRLLGFATWIQDIRTKTNRKVTVISDHGNAPTQFQFVDYGKILKDHGYHVAAYPFEKGDLFVPRYSTVSFFSIHCRNVSPERVAQLLSDQPGVDVTACRDQSHTKYLVFRHSKRAAITKSNGDFWYQQQGGDPLDLGNLQRNSDCQWRHDVTLGAGNVDWVTATWEHKYPNPLERICDAFDMYSAPASVVVSLEPDIVFGLPIVHRLYNAVCMHGGIRRDASVAFVLRESGNDISPARAHRMGIRQVRELLGPF